MNVNAFLTVYCALNSLFSGVLFGFLRPVMVERSDFLP